MPQTTTSRPREALPSGMVVKILLSAAFWNGSENFAVCAVGVCKVRCPLRILFGAIETNSGCRKKPRPILLCLPLVSQTIPLLHFCAAEKKKPFPRRHATTEMRTRIKITMIVRARGRANVSVYLTEIPLAQHELGRETTDRNKRFCDRIFRKMNTVAKPRTTVQMLSTAVRVFSENEYGREAADHSADVINGTKNIRHYTVTPHHSRHPSHLTTSNITTHSHLTISHITRRNKENTKKKFVSRVLGPDGILATSHINTSHHITTHDRISPDMRYHISPHHTLQAERREHKEEALASHITSPKKGTQRRSSWAEFLGRMAYHTTSHTSHLTTSHITSRKERTHRRSSWAEFLGRMAHHTTHITDITSHHITHHKSQAERREHREEVVGPSPWARWLITPHHRHHISPHHTLQAERREHTEEVLGRSSSAGWLTTPHHRHHISPHHTSQAERREHREEVVGPSSWAGEAKSHHITHHT